MAAKTLHAQWQDECFHLVCAHENAFSFKYQPSRDVLIFSRFYPEAGFEDIILEDFTRLATSGLTVNQDLADILKSIVGAERNEDEGGRFECSISIPTAADGNGQQQPAESEGKPRWWRFLYVYTQDGTRDDGEIAGIAIDIQTEKDKEAQLAVSFEKDIVFLQSMTSNALMALSFDIETGKRITTAGDVLPDCMTENIVLADLIDLLESHAATEDGKRSFAGYADQDSIRACQKQRFSRTTFDCPMTSIDERYNGTRWIGVTYHYSINPNTDHPVMLVYLVDINEKKTAELDLIDQTTVDPLTGLLNRSTFQECCNLRHELLCGNEKTGSHSACALVIIEFALFETVNDAYGHPFGDHLLQQTANTLRALMHSNDLAARFNGAQFAMLMCGITDRSILHERIRVMSAALANHLDDDNTLTSSIGVSICPDDGDSFDELYQKADTALYSAKEPGGDPFVFYSSALEGIERKHHVLPATSAIRPGVKVRTFGFFDVFVADEPVIFRSAKCKELLALLVDRRGGFITSREAVGYLWENEMANSTTLARYRKVAMRLKQALEENGIANIVETNNGARRIVPEQIDCDLFNYLSGTSTYANLFNGSYMSNYSWSENTLALLTQRKNQL